MDLHTQSNNLRGISLCAGYAGLDLGLHIAEPGYRTVAFVEREAHAAATLVARMEDASLAPAPVWDDLKSFDGRPWRNRVHIIIAGYPCQPFSLAGARRGTDDPRHLWPDVARIISEVEPEWVFCENVEGHISLGLADVAAELRGMGYIPKAGMFSAREAGASHIRRRVFLLAHADSQRWRLLPGSGDCRSKAENDRAFRLLDGEWGAVRPQHGGAQLEHLVSGNESDWVEAGSPIDRIFPPGPGEFQEWDRILHGRPGLQPALLRSDDGVADRVERSRAAGNGVCSLAAAIAWKTLSTAHRQSAAAT
ncbi:DNA cytosine methyltransferase [Sphingomonas bisphenolicum]|uniref:DNA cytosine methyltransferase n=1 Tax=Sphingomonas bisphenolicum TaxID=296544 RepID=UPI0021C3C48D|nr:DNA cytosine methyltransferase [Sphingomonas bisphenolicum]